MNSFFLVSFDMLTITSITAEKRFISQKIKLWKGYFHWSFGLWMVSLSLMHASA